MNQNADEQVVNKNNEIIIDKSNEINKSMLLSTYSLDDLEEQYIVVMGDYTASLPFVNEMSGKGATNTIFSKNATVTGNLNVLIQGVNTNVTNYGSVK